MVAHPGVHVQQLDLLDVHAVLFTEGAEEWCVGRRQRLTDALTLQILGCLDRRTAKNAYTHSRFVIDDHLTALLAQPSGELLGLGRFARAVDAFDHDEHAEEMTND